MKISENYDVRELVPPEIYAAFGDKSVRFVNKHCADFLEWLSSYLGVHIVVNNWHFFLENPAPTGDEDWFFDGHIYRNSGFRTKDCKEGADNSQHRMKDALDCKAKGFEAELLRQVIREQFSSLNKRFQLTTIEKDTPTWLHVDFRWTMMDELLEVPYK